MRSFPSFDIHNSESCVLLQSDSNTKHSSITRIHFPSMHVCTCESCVALQSKSNTLYSSLTTNAHNLKNWHDVHSIYSCSKSYDCSSHANTTQSVKSKKIYHNNKRITIYFASESIFPAKSHTQNSESCHSYPAQIFSQKNSQNRERKIDPSSRTFCSTRPHLHMSNKHLSNTKGHIINLTDISNLISSWLMNFKYPAPLPLRHRFHCPIRVTLNACTNPIWVMPVIINGLDYPSNRPFSHYRRRFVILCVPVKQPPVTPIMPHL